MEYMTGRLEKEIKERHKIIDEVLTESFPLKF